MRRGLLYFFYIALFSDSINRLVDEFKQMLHQWTTWDIITMLQNHQTIKDSVRDLFHQVHCSQSVTGVLHTH